MPAPKDPLRYEEWKSKCQHKGNIPWNKGKHHSEETKQKIREKALFRKFSKEAIERREATRRKHAKERGYWMSEKGRNILKQRMLGNKYAKGIIFGNYSEERCNNISIGLHKKYSDGYINPTKGTKRTPEQIERNRLAHIGSNIGDKNPAYRGGKKLARMRANTKRRKLGYLNLNEPFDNSVGHHIDIEHVVYIPKILHEGIKHSAIYPEKYNNGLDRINKIIIIWIFMNIPLNMYSMSKL